MLHAPTPSDAKRATHDGYIWPLTRDLMTSRDAIRERMLEDIRETVHDGGAEAVVTLADLVNLGWTAEQVMAHGVSAFAAFRAERQQGWKRRRRMHGLATGIEAAALALFLGNLCLWAGIASGSI